MKKTGTLEVFGQSGQKSNNIVIHPNDGFDLGLMSLKYDAKIYANMTPEEVENGSSDFIAGAIHLENNCKPGTIELNVKYWTKIGKPGKIVLYYDDGKLLLAEKK